MRVFSHVLCLALKADSFLFSPDSPLWPIDCHSRRCSQYSPEGISLCPSRVCRSESKSDSPFTPQIFAERVLLPRGWPAVPHIHPATLLIHLAQTHSCPTQRNPHYSLHSVLCFQKAHPAARHQGGPRLARRPQACDGPNASVPNAARPPRGVRPITRVGVCRAPGDEGAQARGHGLPSHPHGRSAGAIRASSEPGVQVQMDVHLGTLQRCTHCSGHVNSIACCHGLFGPGARWFLHR